MSALSTFITHEGRLFTETLEEIDWLALQLASEKSEIVIRYPDEREKFELWRDEIEEQREMELIALRAEIPVLKIQRAYAHTMMMNGK